MRRVTKFHGIMATLRGETDQAVQMDGTHLDYGTMPGMWVPKSVIHQDSLDVIAEADEGDTVEIFIAGWWFRRNYGEVS